MKTPEQLLKKVMPPMLATLAESPPKDGENWTYELKYDGFRAISAIVDGRIAMWSRNGIDLRPRFPKIGDAIEKLKLTEAVIDGEIVALDEEGRPRFQLLQQGGREKLFVFDILWLDGHDLRKLTYLERRELLEKALRKSPSLISISERFEESGADALARAKASGLEGIIAKKKTFIAGDRLVASRGEGRRRCASLRGQSRNRVLV